MILLISLSTVLLYDISKSVHIAQLSYLKILEKLSPQLGALSNLHSSLGATQPLRPTLDPAARNWNDFLGGFTASVQALSIGLDLI